MVVPMATKVADVWNVVHGLKPAILMVGIHIAFAGVNVLYKLTVNDGMNLRIVVAFHFIFATFFIAPLALILERYNTLPTSQYSNNAYVKAFLNRLEAVRVCVCIKVSIRWTVVHA